MDLVSIVALLALGCATGFLAGLLGIGGGMIIVPFMALTLERAGVAHEHTLKIAIATSLATVLFTAISSVRAHHRKGSVRWDVVRSMAPGIVVGAFVAAQIVDRLDSRLIAAIFSAFIAWSAYGMLRGKAAQRADGSPRELPGAVGIFGAGALIGLASGFLGAGGGFLTVPFLSRRGVPMAHAVGSSAACGIPIALGGTVGYVRAGLDLDVALAMLGYLWLPGLAAVAIARC
ncbi:MAG: sulfite exporter TauE/SafE family protein [Burkholderiaceae bacterium]